MFLTPVRLWALLCLALALQLATAQSFHVVARADDPTPAASSPPPDSTKPPTETGKDDNDKDGDAKPSGSDISASITATPTGNNSTASGTSTTGIIPTSTSLDNSTFLNVTIPAGQLPIQPSITPGWGVAGIIMILSGIVYAMVGIKNPWVHAFFSTAYMSALGITVLIIYVMNVPLSNALQGGYVAAIILSGCAIGAASMFFKELTEGLGCALGGFCISMWLLCLVPGGLLHSTASKAIFIACFTLVGFAFYFSRFTRDWSLIVSIAFAGATVTVLGIDCYSRAGLKEFWAYIWALNDNLFPLGADTYPVTRGIRVEIAAIIIIFLIATMSQVRLWKLVREKREKRAAQRAEGQRNLEEEEANVGRQIEEANARDRAEWERVYGDGTAESATVSHISDGGDMHEKGMNSKVYAARNASGEATDIDHVSDAGQSAMDQLMAGEGDEGGVTVRVGADEMPAASMVDGDDDYINEKAGDDLEPLDDAAQNERRASKVSAKSKRISGTAAASNRMMTRAAVMTPSPEVVPLPFNVPKGRRPRSERSSVATFADAEDDVASASPRRVQRNSMVKRLSQGSATLLRSFSQRSGRSGRSGPSAQVADFAANGGESSEQLIDDARKSRHGRDNESLAATMDEESVSGGDRNSMTMLEDDEAKPESEDGGDGDAVADKEAPVQDERVTAHQTETPAAPDVAEAAAVSSKKGKRNSTTGPDKRHSIRSQVIGSPHDEFFEAAEESVYSPQSEFPKSVAASELSGPVSLTKDRLPSSLSRVALSYRTNEWAKHLSNADLPSVDDLPVEKTVRTKKPSKERAKPVNIEDLQRTAEDGAPAPALPRSVSRASMQSMAASQAAAPITPATEGVNVMTSPKAAVENESTVASPVQPTETPAPQTKPQLRSVSSTNMRKISPTVQPIPEEDRSVYAESATIPAAGNEEPPSPDADASPVLEPGQFAKPAAVPGVVSYSSPQTLLGQREMFLRTRSQGSLINTVGEMQTAPPPRAAAASDAGSLYDYPMYAAAFADPDEIPLSQRRSMILGSRMSMNESSYSLNRSESRAESNPAGADNLNFNSHQPKRNSGLPNQAARNAQLANFRMSVSQDLRAGSPMMNSGRETPFASTNSLLGGREADVQRNIEMQRHVLMGQKEAEAQKREMQRRDKEFSDRAFDDRMRSGDLLDAHREAMRKMQRGTR